MKKAMLLFGTFIGLFFSAFAQEYPLKVLQFAPQEKAGQSFEKILLNAYGLPDTYGVIQIQTTSDEKNKKSVHRLQETFAGIPIDQAIALVHLKNGSVERIIANWPKTPVNIPAIPRITLENASKIAVDAVGAGGEILQQNKKEGSKNLMFWRSQGQWFLVYEFDVEVTASHDVQRVLVDALTGKVVHQHSTGHSCCTPATANLNYGGTQTIITEAINGGYVLNACVGADGNGNCIAPVGRFATIRANNQNFTNSTTNWTGFTANTIERCALDAHWGTQAVFNYYQNISSLNQNVFYGNKLTNIMDATKLNNASYYPATNTIIYGQVGNTGRYLTSLDIVAHELTHQVTVKNSNLDYYGESGAINEALSDIFAVAIEAQYGSLDWTMGEDVSPQRSLSNPGLFFDPDTYQGFHWATGTNDNGGVHTNSGVINFWFYLLVTGGNGTNDLGNAYEVSGIGMNKAMILMSLLQSDYLTPTTNMHEFRELARTAAGELWGYCGEEYIAVVNAFYAVGLGEQFGAFEPIDKTWEKEITSCSVTLHWKEVVAERYMVRYWPVSDPLAVVVEYALTNELFVYNLTPNTRYEWEVFAVCGDFLVPCLKIDNFRTLDSCPPLEQLAASKITTCSANLSWPDLGVWQYQVDYQIQGAGMPGATVVTQQTSLTLSSLQPGTTYQVVVTPFCGDQCYGLSDTLKFTTKNCLELQNLKTFNNPCYLGITWDIQEDQTYFVEMTITDPETQITIVDSATVNYLGNFYYIRPLYPSPGLIIEVKITIICKGDNCENQRVQTFTFIEPEPEGTECEAPSNISVQYFGSHSLISWDAPANGNGRFEVRLEYPSNGGSQSQIVFGNKAYFTSESGSAETCAKVSIQAECGCNEGSLSLSPWAEEYFCPPCLPSPGMSLTAVCRNYATISFVPTPNALEYRVRYWPKATPQNIMSLSPDLPFYYTSFNLFDLIPGTEYVVELTALCDQGNASAPVLLEFTTNPAECTVPSNLSYTTLSSGMVRITWDPIPGVAFYNVRYRLGTPGQPWTTLQVLNNFVELNGLDLNGCLVYTLQVNAVCSTCTGEYSAFSPVFNFPECMPALHIGMEAGQTCDPCENNCYVCVVDDQGQKISSIAASGGFWYKINWTVPDSYPVPGYTLNNRECIDMDPGYEGEIFIAFVRKMCTVNGVPTEVCQRSLLYKHDCSGDNEALMEVGGTSVADAAHPAQLNNPAPEFSIYPNPGAHDFNLSSNAESAVQSIILDTYGRRLQTTMIEAGSTVRVKTSEWPSGVYYIRLTGPEGIPVETLRWVKL